MRYADFHLYDIITRCQNTSTVTYPKLQLLSIKFFSSHVGNEQKKRQTVRQAKCINQDGHAKEIAYHRDYLSPRWVCAFALWGSVGTNAASHHSPGSQLPITAQLFPADQAANATQRATVKTQTHSDHAVTLPLKCLSLILLSEGDFLSLALMICIFFSFVLFLLLVFLRVVYRHHLESQVEHFLIPLGLPHISILQRAHRKSL